MYIIEHRAKVNTSSVPFDNTSDDSINITIVITQAGKKGKMKIFIENTKFIIQEGSTVTICGEEA